MIAGKKINKVRDDFIINQTKSRVLLRNEAGRDDPRDKLGLTLL